MNKLTRAALVIAVALGGTALALPAAARDVAWSVSVGGPGFAINAGQPAFGPVWRPAFRPVARPFVRPVVIRPVGFRTVGFRPVVVAPRVWVAPPVFVAPRPVFFAPHPVFAPRVVVAPRPFVVVNAFPNGRWTH